MLYGKLVQLFYVGRREIRSCSDEEACGGGCHGNKCERERWVDTKKKKKMMMISRERICAYGITDTLAVRSVVGSPPILAGVPFHSMDLI